MSGNEEFVRQVREAGESLIKNSNDIVGDAKYLNGIDISIEFDLGSTPTIKVVRSFTPETYVERVMGGER